MGAIGGVVDFRNCNIDFSSLKNMKNAQSLRGRKSSVAYIDSGIGMFYNSDGSFENEQPIFSERRGYKSSLVIDSNFFDGKLAMEGYRAYGVEFIGMLDIPFAMALYDGERRMLLLARDKNGKKPLYYTLKAGKVFFSSEPKGILSIFKDSIRVNADILSLHLTSPVGIYGAADIYPDIFEIRAGECILFTELGMSKFFYRKNLNRKISSRVADKSMKKAIEPNFDVGALTVFSSLDDSLVAFDMPQFDVYMPSLCNLFFNLGATEESFRFVDHLKRYNISYSYEREDRLNSFYGKRGIGVMAKHSDSENENIENMKNVIFDVLKEAFFQLERNDMLLVRKILGDAKMNCFLGGLDKKNAKKENTEQIIRILGMIYQTVKWSKLRELELLLEK